MSNVMEYKGYVGSLEFSKEDMLFYGKVLGISALISFEGSTAEELVDDFHQAVEDYLALCSAEGREPEKAYKGSFNVRVAPQLHQRAALRAVEEHTTLNHVVEQALSMYLGA